LSKPNTADESTKLIRENSFIFYKPRDIVSGDFYWFHEIGSIIIIAAADGTGHGVPGAFMSMIGISLFNQVVLQNNILNPGEIIKQMDKEVVRILKPEEGGTNDGMEMVVCAIDLKKNTLVYAGAKRPLYMVRNKQLYDKTPSIYSLGGAKHEKEKEFPETEILIEPGDAFYIFSDGYIDQFGGEKNKRFTSKRFKELLISISELNVAKQKDLIESNIINWQGNYKQTDDILVMGLKI
jgi:serine phosphatase RsbU (regulator of sigma subunit)